MRRGAGWAAALCLLALVGCGGRDTGGAVRQPGAPRPAAGPPGVLRSQVPAAVAATGVLRVGAAIGRAPLLFYGTGTRQLEGLEYDLLQGIGHALGLQVQVVDEPFAQLAPQLLARRTDIVMSGFADLKIYQKEGIDFVDYLNGRSAVLVRHGDPGRVRGPDGLCAKTVGALARSAQDVAATSLGEACKGRGHAPPVLRVEGEHSRLLDALAAGRVDALLDDAVVAQYTAQVSTGSATLEVAGEAVNPLPYGVGVAKDNPQLRDAVQGALRAMVASGAYDSALAHWGGDEAALRSISVNAGP